MNGTVELCAGASSNSTLEEYVETLHKRPQLNKTTLAKGVEGTNAIVRLFENLSNIVFAGFVFGFWWFCAESKSFGLRMGTP